jgi:hypothetical protein
VSGVLIPFDDNATNKSGRHVFNVLLNFVGGRWTILRESKRREAKNYS